MGMVCATKKGKMADPSPEVAKAAAGMSEKDACDFARTKHKGLPKKVAEESNPRIPRKKGQPANSKKHSDLYTDENPKGTIHGLGFKDVATAKASVAKIKKSSRSHAHKIQAAIAMEQRARVMGKTSEAAIFRKYINSMKKKTEKRKTLKEFLNFFKKKKVNLTPPPPVPNAADIQRAYGVAPRTSDGRGARSTVMGLEGPRNNRVGSVNRDMNRFANTRGWQSAIGRAEHGGRDNQYNVMYGGGKFDTTKGHPDTVVSGGRGPSSAAAGKYQFMPSTWKGATGSLKTPMTPANQDKAATKLLKGRGVNLNIPMNRPAVSRAGREWASLPNMSGKSHYGQPVKSYSTVKRYFNQKKKQELGPDYRDAPGANYAR